MEGILDESRKKQKYHSPTLPAARALGKSFSENRHLHQISPSSSQSSTSSTGKHKSDPLARPETPLHSSARKRHASLPRTDHRRSNDNAKDPSPTDSHPRAHTRNRSRESLSTLLLLTTDRLNQETARANAAERQSAELLSQVRNNREQRAQVEREFQRVREELSLYKIQLDLAQKEILRAQAIVDDVDRQRVAAEHRADRNRDRARKLLEERMLSEALEEGRKEGYREGLARGRALALAEQPEPHPDHRPRRNTMDAHVPKRGHTAPPVRRREPTPPAPQRPSSRLRRRDEDTDTNVSRTPSRRSLRPTIVDISDPEQTPVSPHVPDTARFRPQLPVPTITTPIQIEIPSTQPQQPPERTSYLSSSVAEDIDVHPPTPPRGRGLDQIRPISVRNRSPSVSHASIILPPDGYIPMLGADNSILLPPPHELSIPVPPVVDHQRPQTSDTHHEKAPRVRDYAYEGSKNASSSSHAQRRQPKDEDATAYVPQTSRVGTVSVKSHGSTRISQYDLVSPPRDQDRERVQARNRSDLESPTPLPRKGRSSSRSQPQQMAEQWRFENSDILKALSTSSPSVTSSRRPRGYSIQGSNAGPSRSNANEIERPTTVEPRPNAPRSPRVTGGPRLQHDLVPLQNYHRSGLASQVTTMVGDEASRHMNSQKVVPPGESHASISRLATTPPSQMTEAIENRDRHLMQRSMTTTTVPGIGVEPPSNSPSNVSEGTAVDPVLLTPDAANVSQLPPTHPIPHIDQPFVGYYAAPPLPVFNYGESLHEPLSHNNFPPGFVPLGPIPALTNSRHSNDTFYTNPTMNYDWVSSGIYAKPGATPRSTTHADTFYPVDASPGTQNRFSPAPLDRPISLFSED